MTDQSSDLADPYVPLEEFGPHGNPDTSFIGDFLRDAGYQWLGPGTDIEYNVSHDMEPHGIGDGVARDHDLAYYDTRRQFLLGEIDYEEASRRISEADKAFSRDILRDPNIANIVFSAGMGAKRFIDLYMGPSWAGIYPGDWARDAPKYDDWREQDGPAVPSTPSNQKPPFVPDADAIRAAGHATDDSDMNNYVFVNGRKFDLRTLSKSGGDDAEFLGIQWDTRNRLWVNRHTGMYYREPLYPGRPDYMLRHADDDIWDGYQWVRPKSGRASDFDLDRDRNYYPDRLQAVKKKKRTRRSHRKHVRSTPYQRRVY